MSHFLLLLSNFTTIFFYTSIFYRSKTVHLFRILLLGSFGPLWVPWMQLVFFWSQMAIFGSHSMHW